MKKKYIDKPTENEVTYKDLIEAAVRQAGTVKTILADLKTLMKLKAVVRQKHLKRLRFEASQRFANAKSK